MTGINEARTMYSLRNDSKLEIIAAATNPPRSPINKEGKRALTNLETGVSRDSISLIL